MNNKKYNILSVHNYYKIPGGEDSVVANEKELLESNGHKVYLYTRSNKEIDKAGIGGRLLMPVNAVFSWRTYKEVKTMIGREKIDIVHVHNTFFQISPSVYYAAIACGVPVVQTVHNFRFICPGALLYRQEKVCEECLEKGPHCAIKYGCYRGSKVHSFISAAVLYIHRALGTYKKIHYICLTEFNKSRLLQVNKKKKSVFPEENIWVKPNFAPDIEVTKYGHRKDMFLYVGRLEPEKGIEEILKAWKRIEKYELVVCGTGSSEKWCRDFVKKNHISNVTFMGQQPRKQVVQLMAEAQALIFGSKLYEGLPMTIIESFSCGTPVIVNNIGNGAALVQDGINGIKYDINSVESLAEKIQNWKPGMSEAARESYLSKYTPEANYKMLTAIYNNIIEKQ